MRKINYSKLFILGVFVYIIFQIGVMFISKNTKIEVLENKKLDLKIHSKGLIIRDEYVLKSDESGMLKLLVKEGEKVKKSQEVAKIYTNKKDINLDEKIKKLDEEIKNIKKSNTNNVIDKNKLKLKKEEKKILENKREEDISILNSKISGIVSYKFDGNEEEYKNKYFDEITEECIKNSENKDYGESKDESKVNNDETIMRIINPNDIYVAICINPNDDNKFKKGKFVKLQSKTEVIEARIEEKHIKKSNIVVILKITNQNVGIYDARVKEFDIIYSEIEGLRIPKQAIKNENGSRGVYVVEESSGNVNFVKLDGIIYENDDFVFVDYYNNNIKGIKTVNLYDKIILKPNSINKKILHRYGSF